MHHQVVFLHRVEKSIVLLRGIDFLIFIEDGCRTQQDYWYAHHVRMHASYHHVSDLIWNIIFFCDR